MLDGKAFNILAGFHKIELRARKLSLLGELIAKFDILFLFRKKTQIIRVEFLGGSFHEDRGKSVFLVHVAQELLDLHLGLIVSVGVLNVKNELRAGRSGRFVKSVHGAEFRGHINA